MPQKRRTKIVRHSRNKPKMTADTDVYNLTARQKKDKLDLLLKDFDAEGNFNTERMYNIALPSNMASHSCQDNFCDAISCENKYF